MEIISTKQIGKIKLYLIGYYNNVYHIAKDPAGGPGRAFLVEQFTADRTQAIKHFQNLLG